MMDSARQIEKDMSVLSTCATCSADSATPGGGSMPPSNSATPTSPAV